MQISKRLSVIENIIILFLYVFGVLVPIVRTTSLALILYLPFRISKPSIKSRFKDIVSSRYIFNLVSLYLFLCIAILLFTTINLKFDITLLPTIINNVIHLIIAGMIVALFIGKGLKEQDLLIIILIIFVIQSIIQVTAFISPAVHSFIQIFQSSSTVEIADKFSGRRGLALAGAAFFGLASIYGLIFIFYSREIIISGSISYINIVGWILILIGGFFSGRTFFIGVGFGLIYLFNSNLSIKKKIQGVKRFAIVLVSVILICMSLIPPDMYKKINDLSLYVFEAVYNYIDSGKATTTSSDHLLEDMFFEIPLKTIIIGDGQYTDNNGDYYMHTDSGYMRNLLLYGLSGSLLTIFIDVYLMWGTKRLRKHQYSKLSTFIFLYMLILHIKGETFAYLLNFHCILFIYYFFIQFTKAPNENRYSH